MYRRKELKNKKKDNVWEEGYFCVIKKIKDFSVNLEVEGMIELVNICLSCGL